MLKEKSAKEYIADNDFEGAKARLEKTTIRWELYWYEVCYEIATNDKRWFSLYNFYPNERRIAAAERTETTFLNEVGNFVYLIKMFDVNDEYVFLKGGKTVNLKVRMAQLSKTVYKTQDITIARIEVIKVWKLPTEQLAVSFEHMLHDYFCNKNLEYFRQDRFTPSMVTEKDFEELEKRYEIVKSLS